jgi:hypothetical protein
MSIDDDELMRLLTHEAKLKMKMKLEMNCTYGRRANGGWVRAGVDQVQLSASLQLIQGHVAPRSCRDETCRSGATVPKPCGGGGGSGGGEEASIGWQGVGTQRRGESAETSRTMGRSSGKKRR